MIKITHHKKTARFLYIYYSFNEDDRKNFIKFSKNSYFCKKRSYGTLLKILNELRL